MSVKSSPGPMPLEVRPHALYRFFNAGGALLYVGITAALPTRLANHRDEKPWWTEVARVTVEHYPNREAVLAAELAAIKSEHPRYNIQHNTQPANSMGSAVGRKWMEWPGDRTAGIWQFQARCSGYRKEEPLQLYWEVYCDAVTDDWAPEEIPAEELWRVWLTRNPRDAHAEAFFGPGAMHIWWFVEGPGIFETAPLQHQVALRYVTDDFLAHYTVPRHADTGELIQWTRLPVVDKLWRPGRGDKGGFIQEATGWRPSPLQPFVNVRQLAAAAGLFYPANGESQP